jgi:hypothetical protein
MLTISSLDIGSLCESERLDFKAKYWKDGGSGDWTWELELAKDLAALANAIGGYIVVGATENGGVLSGFINPELPQNWEAGFQRVVGSFLRPSPLVFPELVALDVNNPGVKQLIIEVVPSELVVAVTNPSDARARLMVPVRHGSHTVPLPADRAIMQIASPFRRWSIRLEGIKFQDHRVRLMTDKTSHYPELYPYQFIETMVLVDDVEIDSVTLRHFDGRRFVLPFDYIEAIWRSNQENIWIVIAQGKLDVNGFVPRGV